MYSKFNIQTLPHYQINEWVTTFKDWNYFMISVHSEIDKITFYSFFIFSLADHNIGYSPYLFMYPMLWHKKHQTPKIKANPVPIELFCPGNHSWFSWRFLGQPCTPWGNGRISNSHAENCGTCETYSRNVQKI